jgi:cysteine desulfurase
MKPIYLDYAATTPVDPRVAAKMFAYLTSEGHFGNAASQHAYGLAAREAVEDAREQVAAYLQADASEIIWTSCATESINLALKGAAQLYQRKGKHLITMKTEHKAVLDTCMQLEKDGWQVTYLMPEPDGLLDLNKFQNALREDTVLISMMHVNNETGVIQDVAAIAQLTAARGILCHIDAAQSPGKLALNVQSIPADLISLGAHKLYGPKGIGALYLRKKPRVRVSPLIHGGGHEQGMRSGTLATHQIVGMGEAFDLAQRELTRDTAQVQLVHERFLRCLGISQKFLKQGDYSHAAAGLLDGYSHPASKTLKLNTHTASVVPHIVNLRFDGMIADAILAQLPGIAASTASACQGKGTEGSYVLRAMGLSSEQIKSSVRFSFGRFTTMQEVDDAVKQILGLFC